MKLWKRSAGLWGYLLGAASLAGCTVQAGVSPEPAPPPPDLRGEATISWTIAGSNSPLQCSYYGDDSLSLAVYDGSGLPVTTTYAACEAFEVTLKLDPGTYSADATLVDVNKQPRSLTLPINDIVVTTGTNITVNVDFPARSML